MNIWHSGADATPSSVNGVSSLIYILARSQSSLGHRVSLLLSSPPEQAALQFAKESGVRFLSAVPDASDFTRQGEAPDVVHMHSVFIPNQWHLSRALGRYRTPYLITPHGGLSPHILARNAWKKMVYNALIEKKRFRRASAITIVTAAEEGEIRAFVPDFKGLIECIPNAVDPLQLESGAWKPEQQQPQVVYLGRFDIQHKGIDILLELAKNLPEVAFHLYGTGDTENSPDLRALIVEKPANVTVHAPVFGESKARVLAGATLYIQTSRWEAFGISIAEAMYVGVPCAIAAPLHLAAWFREHGLGLVLSHDLAQAAVEISSALSNPEQLLQWSERSKLFARKNFNPQSVAEKYTAVYQKVVQKP